MVTTIAAHAVPHRYLFAPMATLLHTHAHRALDQLARAMKAVRKRPDHKGVHGLRVALKKVRTLLRLADAMELAAAAPKGATKRLLALFKAAGEQREPEVSMQVLGTFRGHDLARSAYRAHLDVRAKKAAKSLSKALKAMGDRDLERILAHLTAISQGMTRSQERKAASRYISAELAAARTMMANSDRDDALHEVRKHLKNAWHTLRLLDRSGALEDDQQDDLKRLGDLQESLGDWHDLFVVWADLGTRGSTVVELRNAVEERLHERRRQLVDRLRKVLGA